MDGSNIAEEKSSKPKTYSYKTSYKDASTIGRWLLLYGNPLVSIVNKMKCLPLDSIEDLNLSLNDTNLLNE